MTEICSAVTSSNSRGVLPFFSRNFSFKANWRVADKMANSRSSLRTRNTSSIVAATPLMVSQGVLLQARPSALLLSCVQPRARSFVVDAQHHSDRPQLSHGSSLVSKLLGGDPFCWARRERHIPRSSTNIGACDRPSCSSLARRD